LGKKHLQGWIAKMAKICVLSTFDADISWVGRATAVRDIRGGMPCSEIRRSRVILSDVEALLPIMISVGDGAPFSGRMLLLIDSMGPSRLPARFASEIRSRRNVVLGYGIKGHRAGYIRRGVPASRLVWLPAALTYFPIMMPDYERPVAVWTPPKRPRVFCGGKVWRDWETLRQASDLFDARVEVVTELGRVNLGSHPNITAQDRLPFGAFCAGLSRSTCMVLPLEPGRCAGQATLLLAMHMGVPAVVTSIPAMREYVHHGKDGLLVKSRDPHSLAAAARRLIGDPSFAAVISRTGMKTARGFEKKAGALLDALFSGAGA
jgi:hypothetical protein